ncbi:hypothetical protein [Streptomyces sp. NPDC002104]
MPSPQRPDVPQAAPAPKKSAGKRIGTGCGATAAGRARGAAYTGPKGGGPGSSTENGWYEEHHYPGTTKEERNVRGHDETSCRAVARAK